MDCPLCNIERRSVTERIYFEDNEVILLDAKTKKGHAKRIMFVLKEHRDDITPEEEIGLIQKFAILVSPQFINDQEFYIYGTMSTIKEHWHKIACLKNEKADDYKELFGAPRDDLIKIEVRHQVTS